MKQIDAESAELGAAGANTSAGASLAETNNQGPGRALTIRNLLDYCHERSTDLLGLLLVAIAVLAFLDFQALRPQPLDFADLGVPFLYGNPEVYLSNASPWYEMFASLSYETLHQNFGFALNGLDVFSYALAPLGMYLLLDQLRFSRIARIGGSLFFLINPFTLQLAPGYLEYSTFWFAAPIVLALLIRYDRSRARRELLAASLLTFVLLQVNPLDGIRLIVPITLGFWLLPFLKRRGDSVVRVAKDMGVALGLLLVLYVVGDLAAGSANNLGYWFSAGSNASSPLYQFTISQIQFTYQGQSYLNSLTLITVYPGSTMQLLAYSGTLTWVVWILVVGACLAGGTIRAAFRRGRDSQYYLTLLATLTLLVGLEVGISSGYLLPAFNRLPFLLDYEYPTVIQLVQIVIYAVFFGAFINEWPQLFHRFKQWLRTVSPHTQISRTGLRERIVSTPTRPAVRVRRFRRAGPYLRSRLPTVAAVAALVIIPSVPLLEVNRPESVNLSADSSNYLPGYFGEVGGYLHSRSGDSRVLPLPLNYTTILQLESAVPPGGVFGIPYAGVNNPSAYPSVGRVVAVLGAIQNDDFSHLAGLLALNNIEYIVILNLGSASPMSLDSNAYDPYLNGGGSVFLRAFEGAANFSSVVSSSNFAIYRDDLYVTPIVQPGYAYQYRTTSSVALPESDYRGLLENPNLTSSNGWSQWTSCNGSQSKYISYTETGVTLSTCPLNDTYTHIPSQTEIYQWTNLTPLENLSVRVKLNTAGGPLVSLIVIFHNASNLNFSRVFYTTNQTFPTVEPGSNGTFQFQVTSPSDAVGGFFGIQDFGGSNGSAGEATVDSLNVFRAFDYRNSYTFPTFPFDPLTTLVLPFSNQTAALSNTTGEIVGTPTTSAVPEWEAGSLSNDAETGTVYFPVGDWTLNFPCSQGQNASLLLLARPVNATATLVAPGFPGQVVGSGWNHFPTRCSTGEVNATLLVSGIGSIGVESLLAISTAMHASPRAFITPESPLEGTYWINVSNPGIAFIMSMEVSSLQLEQNSSLLGSVQFGGLTVWIVSFGEDGAATITLSGFISLNYAMIGYNVTLLAGAALAVALVVLPSLRHRLLKRER